MGNRRYPEAFQGNLKKRYYYEGWYNKIVDKSGSNIFAFIPTIAINKNLNNSEAFIQILNGQTGDTNYIKYDINDFENLSKTEYDIKIKDNFFSKKAMVLDIDQKNLKIRGKIKYLKPISWPGTLFQPNIMSILNYAPFLETYHGIVSMNHILKGELSINGKIINFSDGKGYMEKDWGTSFPEAYIWAQTNHFTEKNMSVILSIALVPLLKIKVTGFFCVLWFEGTFYKFATYTNAKFRFIENSNETLQILIEDRIFNLYLSIDKSNLKFTKLKSPRSGMMSSSIIETLNSQIKVKLYNKKSKILILDDIGLNAGFDISNMDLLY